jgi:ribokinase
VSIVARVGDDAAADEALALLRSGGVNLAACGRDANAPTGIALIAVAPSGENQIVVAPGANRQLRPEMLDLLSADALICQLEVPAETLMFAAQEFEGFFCINLAPALDVPLELIQRADLVVVNETEATHYGDALLACNGFLAITYGADGAVLKKAGEILAESKSPKVEALDATGAGDTFTAALTVAIVEGQEPAAALRFACAAGAAAATKAGAQPSLPFRKDVEELLNQ